MTLAELRAELRRRRAVLVAARRGTGSTAELERGIRNLAAEVARIARAQAEAAERQVPLAPTQEKREHWLRLASERWLVVGEAEDEGDFHEVYGLDT